MARYQLIRDKKIFELNENLIEVCDNKDEIMDFSIKEIINLLSELKESDYKDTDVYVDILAILKSISKLNSIDIKELSELWDKKDKQYGEFSKYLLKIN